MREIYARQNNQRWPLALCLSTQAADESVAFQNIFSFDSNICLINRLRVSHNSRKAFLSLLGNASFSLFPFSRRNNFSLSLQEKTRTVSSCMFLSPLRARLVSWPEIPALLIRQIMLFIVGWLPNTPRTRRSTADRPFSFQFSAFIVGLASTIAKHNKLNKYWPDYENCVTRPSQLSCYQWAFE